MKLEMKVMIDVPDDAKVVDVAGVVEEIKQILKGYRTSNALAQGIKINASVVKIVHP